MKNFNKSIFFQNIMTHDGTLVSTAGYHAKKKK